MMSEFWQLKSFSYGVDDFFGHRFESSCSADVTGVVQRWIIKEKTKDCHFAQHLYFVFSHSKQVLSANGLNRPGGFGIWRNPLMKEFITNGSIQVELWTTKPLTNLAASELCSSYPGCEESWRKRWGRYWSPWDQKEISKMTVGSGHEAMVEILV